MKKFYCLYNRNNLPFSWKLKQANEKPIANFKSREDCLNYYLSLGNIGIIWFQKSSSKTTKKENLKDSFDGYVKTTRVNNELNHVIGIVPTITENAARILKRNLFHSLQIDPATGKDLFAAKGIDRINKNKNSYLIFDNDVVEEILSEYDEKTQAFNPGENSEEKFSSPELLREMIQKSHSNLKEEKLSEEDVVLKPQVENIEYNEIETNGFSQYSHTDTNDFLNNYNSPGYSNLGSESNNDSYNNYEQQNYYGQNYQDNYSSYSNDYYENDYYENWNNFGVNLNDFNFQNDFENHKLKLKPINQNDFLNNNFQNYFNNNGKILKNNFYTLYRDGVPKMNSKRNQFNVNNSNTNNDVWVPVNQNQNASMQRSYGTVEFTAVPNQVLNTELNPLGTSTMIFNPYTMQNTMQNTVQNAMNNPYIQNQGQDTIIQPVIQPVIQQVVKTVYQQQPVTRVLEPIINEPIMANGDAYSDYSQYSQTHTNLLPKTNVTSEFQFNNDAATRQTQVTQNIAPAKVKQPKVKKPKNKKVLYTLLSISTLMMIGIAVVIALLFTGIIVI